VVRREPRGDRSDPEVRAVTQVFDVDDGFADGSPVYGSGLLAYPRHNLDESGSFIHAGAQIYLLLDAKNAELHDGYSPRAQVASGTPLNRVDPPWLASPHHEVAADHALAGFSWRPLTTANDVAVELGWRVAALNLVGVPSGISDWFYGVGVTARLAGGTLTDSGTADERIVDGDGYSFGVYRSATGVTERCQFALCRTVAGVTTVLDLGGWPDPASSDFFDTYDLRPDLRLVFRMEVSDESGDVRLKCYVTRAWAGVFPTAGVTEAEVEVFDYLDSNAAKLTAAGRCGFFCDKARAKADTLYQLADLVPQLSHFSVEDDGTLVHRDEWSRRQRLFSATVTDDAGTDGRSLRSSFDGDDQGDAAFTEHAQRSTDGTWTHRLMFDADGGSSPIGQASVTRRGGAFLSQRTADGHDQRRSIKAVFESSGAAPSGERHAGVLLRCSGAIVAGKTPDSGYCLDLVPDDGGAGTGKLYLRHFTGSVEYDLARVAAETVALDAEHDLELSVQTFANGGDVTQNVVLLQAWFNGATVVWDTNYIPDGVVQAVGGVVVHVHAKKVLEGLGEGVRVRLRDGDRMIFVDAWEQDASLPPVTGENDEASVSMEDEAEDHSGQTFTVPHDWDVDVTPHRFVDAHEGSAGHVFRVLKQSRVRRDFVVRTAALTDAERASLYTFVTAHGVDLPFYFAVEDWETTSAKFTDTMLSVKLRDKGITSYQLALREVFE